MEETAVASTGLPWWVWGMGLWILAAGALLLWDNHRKKKLEDIPAPKSKKSKEQTAVAMGADATAAALLPGSIVAGQDDDLRRPKRLMQGALPLPPGQTEFRLVRTLEGDKMRAEMMILHEQTLVSYLSREEAAQAALDRLKTEPPPLPTAT